MMAFPVETLVVISALLIVTLGLFTWPYWGQVNVSKTADTTDLYKKQMAELEADLADHLITQSDYDSAKAEIGRRLLRAVKKRTKIGDGHVSPLIVGGTSVLLLTGALYSYLSVGRPDLTNNPAVNQVQEAGNQVVTGVDGKQQKVGDLIAQLEAVLETKPDDIQGWTILARTAGKMGDAPRMAKAYGNLARLQPENADWWALQGEALVRISAGMVSPAARFVFLHANKLMKTHPLPRYYLGLAFKQEGNLDRALDLWIALKEDSLPDAPWMQMLDRQIETTQALLKGTSTSPSQAQREAVGDMSAEDQKAFINQMVAGLREKLAENPDDLDGWLRLARAEQVLGNVEGARTALEKALALATGQQKQDIATRLKSLK